MTRALELFAVPPWRAHEAPEHLPAEHVFRPQLSHPQLLEHALRRIEYRGAPLWHRAQAVVESARHAVLARSPVDLAALLRSAEQLVAERERDLRSQKPEWRCACGQRYSVCTALLRPVSIRCDGCATALTLDASIPGRLALGDEQAERVNAARLEVAGFLREAMARGWPVLVNVSAG